MARVAEALGTTAGVLTGADPWPAGGLKPRPKRENKMSVPLTGSLAELAAEARAVADSARVAANAAGEIAQAAERVAARAEAALAEPRLTEVVPAQPAPAPTPTSFPGPAYPANLPPGFVPAVLSPSALAEPPDTRPKKRGTPPTDPLDALSWYTKPRQHDVDHERRQIIVHRKLGVGVSCLSARVDVVKRGGFKVYCVEDEQELLIGTYRDPQKASWIAENFVRGRERLNECRRVYRDGCDYIRRQRGSEEAELLGAEDVQAAANYRYVQVLAALHRWYERLQAGKPDGQPFLGGQIVEQLATAQAWLQRRMVDILALGSGWLPAKDVSPAALVASNLATHIRKQLATLKLSGEEVYIPETAVIVTERLCKRLQELEVIIAKEEADAAAETSGKMTAQADHASRMDQAAKKARSAKKT